MSSLFMKSLNLQNFATFKQQDFSLSSDFNCIVGETGSGKSLILDAIHLILGHRSDKKLIRKDAEFATVEATFVTNSSDIKQFFFDQGFPFEDSEITIKRVIYKNESSKSYVNFLNCSTQILSTFSKKFIDIVGQFENQKLLSEQYQLSLLDRFSGISDEVKTFQQLFLKRNDFKTQLDHLQQTKTKQEAQLDFINFQLDEIDKINPSAEREQVLIENKGLYQSQEKSAQLTTEIDQILNETESGTSLISKLKFCLNIVSRNPDIFSKDAVDLLSLSISSLNDFQHSIQTKNVKELTIEDLEATMNELDLYQKLKRKFGGTIESVLLAAEHFKKEKDEFLNLDFEINKIQLQIKELESELKSTANNISQKRHDSSKRLSELLTEKIQKLNMKGAEAQFVLKRLDHFSQSGIDQLALQIQTNPGEGFHLLKNIASGGELSRILLAFRQILSSTDSISVFLFDEIDTGIGGETAVHIGQALKDVAKNSQVIAISHLPQIAAFSSKLLVVSKNLTEERTESIVREVEGTEIKKEVQLMNPTPL